MPNIDIYSEEFTSANILQAEAGTNCPQGGDSGHGGRTILRLIDQGGTDIRVKVDGQQIRINDSIEIALGGDCEHHTFVEALEFAIKTYKQQYCANQLKPKSEHVE
jgi:hypothetical protein